MVKKFKVGDIVVSLTDVKPYRAEGDLLRVNSLEKGNGIWYGREVYGSSKTFRLATDYEKQFYEPKMNIKDIPKIQTYELW